MGDISSLITKGTTPKDKSGSGEVNFIKVENIDDSSGEIVGMSKISLEEHQGYLKHSQLQEGDILFSIAGTLGRVTSVNKGILPANTNQALSIIRLKEGNLEYVKTCLKGNVVVDFIKRNPTIGTQPNLSLEQVTNLEIGMPSKTEQAKIGEYFSILDHLITLHQHKLSHGITIHYHITSSCFYLFIFIKLHNIVFIPLLGGASSWNPSQTIHFHIIPKSQRILHTCTQSLLLQILSLQQFYPMRKRNLRLPQAFAALDVKP